MSRLTKDTTVHKIRVKIALYWATIESLNGTNQQDYCNAGCIAWFLRQAAKIHEEHSINAKRVVMIDSTSSNDICDLTGINTKNFRSLVCTLMFIYNAIKISFDFCRKSLTKKSIYNKIYIMAYECPRIQPWNKTNDIMKWRVSTQ